MEEPNEPSYRQALQRKRAWFRQRDRQTTNLLFVGSLLMMAALVLYFIPASGVAYLLTSVGALVCILAAIALGLRAHSIESHAQKQVHAYRAALDLPAPEEARSRLDAWTERLLKWGFRLLTLIMFLASLGEIAVLWQEPSSIHPQLILLGATLCTAAAGVVGMWITSLSQEPKHTRDG